MTWEAAATAPPLQSHPVTWEAAATAPPLQSHPVAWEAAATAPPLRRPSNLLAVAKVLKVPASAVAAVVVVGSVGRPMGLRVGTSVLAKVAATMAVPAMVAATMAIAVAPLVKAGGVEEIRGLGTMAGLSPRQVTLEAAARRRSVEAARRRPATTAARLRRRAATAPAAAATAARLRRRAATVGDFLLQTRQCSVRHRRRHPAERPLPS